MTISSRTNGRAVVRQATPALPEQLRRTCEAAEVPADGTAGVEPDGGTFGQRRAREAVEAAAGLHRTGFNVFATGTAGTGKRTMIARWLREQARKRPAPPDIVLLHNFDEPLRPLAVTVPAGTAKELAADVRRLVSDAQRNLAHAFESDSYRARHRSLHDDIDRHRGEALAALSRRANALGVAIQLTPAGAITFPMAGGRPLTPEEAQAMSREARNRYEAALEQLGEPVDAALLTMRDLDRQLRDRHRELDRDVATFAIGHLVAEVQRRWEHAPRVVTWLDAMREDAIGDLDTLRGEDGPSPGPLAALSAPQDPSGLPAKYVVNVLVTNDPEAGAPVLTATDASYYELFGRVEYETAFGAAVTDHRHLRAGLVHRAAGGYLILQATDVLSTPFVWQHLKAVLRTGKLKIENIAVQYMLFPGVTLDPEPVDVDVMVVLVGSTELHQLLHAYDEDVPRLFKVRADFDEVMKRDEEGVRAYAATLARIVADLELPPFDAGAVARIVEHGSRVAEHRDRLSTSMRELADVATESAHVAAGEDAAVVGADHVTAALAARRRRSDLVEQHLREATLEGTIDIDVAGEVAGQVNGLAVASLGDHQFGHAVRITATVAPGEGEVVDIDREARLSGPIHSKGVLILAGYLAGRFATDEPMSLRASIVFEQSYGPVEGDSASTAELLALLSALARLPVDQGIAVTGAVDQHGAVHAVGGVNDKVEGFFDLCDARGLTGRQGVVVPAANLPHLMLAPRVVDAVREGRFSVWPVHTVDEALTLVTGSDTAPDRVRDRLLELAHAVRHEHEPEVSGPARARR